MAIDARSLTPEQREKFQKLLGHQLTKLVMVADRMDQRAWYSADPVRQSIAAAICSIRSAVLTVEQSKDLPPYPEILKPGPAPRSAPVHTAHPSTYPKRLKRPPRR